MLVRCHICGDILGSIGWEGMWGDFFDATNILFFFTLLTINECLLCEYSWMYTVKICLSVHKLHFNKNLTKVFKAINWVLG